MIETIARNTRGYYPMSELSTRKKWNKKMLAVLMQWDYCDPSRGISLDKTAFYNTLQDLVSHVDVIWYDDYINQLDTLQNVIVEKAEEYKPDLIFFIPYTNQFTFNTLDKLKERFETFAWFGDDQWRFESYASKYAPHYTHVATTDPWSISKYEQLGIRPILSQWAANPLSTDVGLIADDEEYKYDVTFVGGFNRYRGWFIEQLKRKGIKVDCFGAGWPNGRISYTEMEQIFKKSKVNLNISNSIGQDTQFVLSSLRNIVKFFRHPKNAEQIKARNFEIPLAGGFQLTNFVMGLERYLEIGKEVAVYTSVDECVNQIQYYLANEQVRKKVIEASHHRAKTEHTYMHRLSHILEVVWGPSNT